MCVDLPQSPETDGVGEFGFSGAYAVSPLGDAGTAHTKLGTVKSDR
jgi:hypothetical protein